MTNGGDPRFQRLKTKIGAFIAVAAIAILVVPFIIGRNSDLFVPKYNLRFTVDKGTGFTKGMPVKLSGFRIGKVKSISLNDAAKVDVVLQIDKKYQRWIRKDSQAKLVKEGLIGDMIVEVSVGSDANPVLGNNDLLACTKTKTLDEVADEIADKVKPVLSEVRDIIGYVNDPKGDVKQSMKNINVLSRNLEATRRHADLLLVKADGQMGDLSERLKGVLNDTSSAVKSVNQSLVQVDQKLPSILEKAERTMQNAEKITADLKTTTDQTLPKVPVLVTGSQQVMESTAELVDATKKVWPVRSFIKQPEERFFVPGDSHE